MTDNNSRKQLFAYLQKKGMYEDEGKFNKDMDSEEGRRALFDTMYQGGAGMSWDEFDANLRPDLNNAAKKETEQAKANAQVPSTGVDNGADTGSQPVNTAKVPKGNAGKGAAVGDGSPAASKPISAGSGKQPMTAAAGSPAGNAAGTVAAGNAVGDGSSAGSAGSQTISAAGEGNGSANGDNADGSAATAAEAAVASGEASSTVADNAGERLAVPYSGDTSNMTTWRNTLEGQQLVKDTHEFFNSELIGRADEFIKYGESRAENYEKNGKYKDMSDFELAMEAGKNIPTNYLGRAISNMKSEIASDWFKDPKKVMDNFNKILGIQKVDGAPKKGTLIKNGKEYKVVNGYVVGTPEQQALNSFVMKQLNLPSNAEDDGKEGEKKVAPLTEEQQQAWLEMYNDKMEKVVDCIQEELANYLIGRNMPKSDIEYITSGAIKDSTFGAIKAIIKDKCANSSKFRMAMLDDGKTKYADWIQSEAEARYLNNMGFWHRALVSGARGAGSMLIDAPVFELAGWKSADLGMKFGNWVGMKVSSKIAGNVAARALSGGMTFGGYDLIQEGLHQVADGELNAGDLVLAYGKGFGTGSLLGTGNTLIDGYAKKLLDGGSKAAYYATHAGGFAGEVAFFSASEIGQATLQNNGEFIGWDQTFEILGKQGVMIGMLKAKGSLEQVYHRQQMMKTISEAAGITKDNLKDLYDAGYTDNQLREMFAGERLDAQSILQPKTAAESEVKDPKKPYLKKISEEERADLIRRIMADENVSWETKQKLMFALTGVVMPNVAPAGVAVNTDEKGNNTILVKDINGNVISKKGVTQDNIQEELFKAQNKVRISQVNQLEGTLKSAVTQLPSAIEQVAKENSMSYGRIVECLKAVEQGNAEKWQEKIANRVKEVSKVNALNENVAWAAEARAAVEKETGVDLDIAMHKKNPTAQEMEAVDSYINRLTEITDNITEQNDWISEKAKATTEARQIVEAFADKLRPHVDQDGNVRQGVIKGENDGKPVFLAPDNPDQPDLVYFYREGEKLPFCVSRDKLVSEETVNFQQAMAQMESQYVDAAVAKVENKKLGYHPDTPAVYTVGQGVTFYDGDGNTVIAKVAAVENGQVTLSVSQVGSTLYDGKPEVYSVDALKKFQSETLKFHDRAAEMSERSGIKYTPEWVLAEQRKKDEQKVKDQETWAVKAQEFANSLRTPIRIFRSIDEVNDAYGAGNPYAPKCKERMQEKVVNGKVVKTGKVITAVKGWLDDEGNVAIFLPSAASEADIKETVLHEIVGHAGIPAVLVDGWYRMNDSQKSEARKKLFGSMYMMLDPETQKKVDNLAIGKYNNNIPLAMDEYFASLAERGEIPSWFGKFSGAIKNGLAAKGFNVSNDGDILYLLWRSRQALSGDGESLFGGVRDLAIRLRLKVDKMIGDKQVPAAEEEGVKSEEGRVKSEEGRGKSEGSKEGEDNGTEIFEVVDENGQPLDLDELGKILEELQASPAEVVSVDGEPISAEKSAGETAGTVATTEAPAESDGSPAGSQPMTAEGSHPMTAASPEEKMAAVAVGAKFGVVTSNGTKSVIEIGGIDSDGMVQVKIWTDGYDQPNISSQTMDQVKELVAKDGVTILETAKPEVSAGSPAGNTAGTVAEGEAPAEGDGSPAGEQPKTAAGEPSAWEMIPVDEKTQKKDYTKASVEQTYQALQEKYGEDADMLAQNALEAATAKYEKIKKDGNPDDTGAAYREVKYWQGVVNHIANKAEEARLAKVAEEASGAVDDIINDGLDPQDAAKQMLTFDEVDKMVKESISNEQDPDKKVAMERYWNTVSEELMPEYTKEYWDKHIRDISSGGSVKEVLDNMDPEMGEKMLMDFGVDQSYDLGMNGSWEGFKRSKIYKIMSTDNNPNISSVISSVSEENRQKRELWKEKYNQVQNRFRDGDEKSEEELSDKERKQRRYSRLSDIMKAVGIMMDKDGNPIDENGDYVYEDFNSAYDITDDDIEGGCRNVRLPLISESMAAAMNIDRRPVVIKRSVFKKNSINHPELGLDGKDQAMVLDKALYSSNEYINDKPKNKPYYWVTVHLADRNAIVTLDVDTSKKDRIEVVGWRLVNDKSLSSIEKRAIKDGGQIIISTHAAADLSALHDRSFSGGKDTNIADNSQINGAESGSNGENILFRDGSEDYPEFDSVDPELKDYAKDYDEVGERFANYSGTIIKRGNSNKKNPMLNFEVGKMVGSQLYVHKDYVPEQIRDLYESAKAGLPKDFEYNCVMWDHKKPDMIRFDASPDFDTAREPITGDYIWMDKDGNFIRKGTSPQIWHHKWCWVGNDYKGFDVQRAYEWSRIFAKGLGAMPSGYENKWQDQLKAAGLGNVRFRDGEEEQISAEEARKDLEESMKEAAKQDYGSAETSLKQVAAAFKKIKWEDGTTNLDLGGGKFDLATEFLKDQGVTSMVFDPFNRDKEHNAQVAQVAQKDGFDTVTCNNVLNVINSDGARSNVILQAAKALKQDGTAYFSIYQGNKSGIGKVSKKNCWQNNRKTASYVEEVAEHFGDVSLKNGVIIAMDPITDGKVSVWNYDAAGSGQSLFRDGEEEVEANDPFYSPAYKAVEDLKQDKGTGEQFLKMIEKNGGLKKEEDKWIGLSDYLKDKKSVTKQEVLDYIRENAVKVEEVHYSEGVKEMEELEDDEFPDFDDWADGKWDEMRGSVDYYERVNAILSEGAEAYAQEMVAKNEYKSEVEIENAFDEFFEEYVEDDLYGSNWGKAETRAIEEWKESVEEEYERLRDEARVKREEYEAVKNSKGKAGNEAGANDTRLHFTLNGLDDKKEIALTVPAVESYTGSFPEIHFTDGYTKGKTVAWIRFGTKEVNGKKVMVIDEIQSQRHQDGREKGYFNDQDIKDRGNKIEELKKQRHDKIVAEGERMKAEFDDPIEKDICRYIFECLNLDCENLQEAVSYCYDNIENYPEEVEGWTNEKVEKVALAINEKAEIPERVDIFSVRVDGVPDAPFQKNWHEVAMKRALRYAAENGYDEVVWTDGATQARRYGLGGEVEDFYNAGTFDALSPENEGMRLKNIDINLRSKIYHLGLDEEGNVVEEYTGDGKVLSGNGRSFGGANISDIVGKDVALQILNLEEGEILKSKDIVVGGDGMKGFYDKMLPSFMNKYGKKWGVKVEPTFIEGVYDRHSGYEVERDGKKGLDMWGVQVTPEMKESVMKGQPMFRDGEESISAEEEKKLYGVHNLSEDNLLHAVKMGGLANPSTAVTRTDRDGLNSFGEISLIMPKSLVEKKSGRNAGTWSADAYSPRYPIGSISGEMSEEGYEKMMSDTGKLTESDELNRKIKSDFDGYVQDGRTNYGGLYYWFLAENGYNPEIVMKQPKQMDKMYADMMEAANYKEIHQLNQDDIDKIRDAYVANMMIKFRSYFNGEYKKGKITQEERDAKIAEVEENERNKFTNDNAYNLYNYALGEYAVSKQDPSEVDTYMTGSNAIGFVSKNDLYGKYKDWLEKKKEEYGVTEKIFDGFTPAGYRKYLPHTLANISKVMKAQGKAGTENMFQTSAGALRAKVSPVYAKLEEMRANQDRIVNEKEMEAIKGEINQEFNELCDMFNVRGDEGFYRLEEAMLYGVDYVVQRYGKEIRFTKKRKERLEAFRELLRTAPTEYFETKFERPVLLDEFVGAVVPKTIGDKARKALEDNGLQIFEYDPEVEGDRKKVTAEASNIEGVRFRDGEDQDPNVAPERMEGESTLDYADRIAKWEEDKRNKVAKRRSMWELEEEEFDLQDAYTAKEGEYDGMFLDWAEKRGIDLNVLKNIPNDQFKGVYRTTFEGEVPEAAKLVEEMTDLEEKLKKNRDEQKKRVDEAWSKYNNETPKETQDRFLRSMGLDPKNTRKKMSYADRIKNYDPIIRFRDGESNEEIEDAQKKLKDYEQKLIDKYGNIPFGNMKMTDEEEDRYVELFANYNNLYKKAIDAITKGKPKGIEWIDNPDKEYEERKDQVNSDNFKEWFGDWTKDPESSSKVVDAKGRPEVQLHATSSGNKGFDIFFTQSDEEANNNIGSHFGRSAARDIVDDDMRGNGATENDIYEVYLDIKNPYETFDWFAQDDCYPMAEAFGLANEAKEKGVDLGKQAQEIINEIAKVSGKYEWAKELIDAYNKGERFEDLVDEEYFEADDKEAQNTLYTGIRKLLKLNGYDGIKYYNDLEGDGWCWVALEPEQIKSAEVSGGLKNNGDFSRKNKNIRFRDPSTEWADGKTKDEVKRIEVDKCNEIIDELKKRGYDDFEKRVSVTNFGTSSYIIGNGLKFRISDHQVSNLDRVYGEIFFTPNDGVDYFLGFIQRKEEETKRVVEASQKRKEFEASLDDKWDKTKGKFDDQEFFRSDPTRKGYDEFAESIRKGVKVNNVVQVPEIDGNGRVTGRYTYIFSMPKGHLQNGSDMPAKEFMLAIDDSGNIVNPKLGSKDMDKLTNKHYMDANARFRWVGEEGARREDESEGNTSRMDGLKLAKKLAKNKRYDANKVKYATGWEQGADGMWRYEEQGIEWNEEVLRNVLFEGDQVGLTVADVIDDDNLLAAYPDLNNVFLHNFVEDDERQKGTRGYYRRSWFQSDVIAVDFETIPDMVKEIRKTKEGIERRRKWIEAYEKGNISDKEREELNILGLTPEGELENMRKRTKRDQDYIKGAEEELEVMVNNVKKTLNHEIQHFIQHQEGWATGGSSERIRSTLNKVADDLGAGKYDYESLNNRYTDLIETSYGVSRAVSLFKRPRYFLKMMDHFKYSGTYDQIVEKGKELAVDAFWKAYDSLSWENRDFGWDMSKFGIDYIEIRDDVERMRNRDDLSNYEQTKALALKWGDKLAKVYRKFAEAKYEDASWGKDMLDRLSKLEKDLRKYSDYELYHNIAGEVEARNAADRMNYTDVTRRMTLAVETESVKRGDQLVLDEHGNMRYGNEYGTRHPLFRDGENDDEGVSPDSDEQVGNWVLGKDGKLRWKEGRGVKSDGSQDPNVAPEGEQPMTAAGSPAGNAAGTVDAAERKKRKNRVKSIGGRAQLLLDEGANGWQDYVRITLCGAKMRGENTEAGTRGLIEHTTGNRKDVANWCAKKGDPDALTPEELAEKIWESMPEGMKEGCSDQDVFNEILDTVMSYKSHKTLLEDLEKSHFEQEVDGIIEYEKEEADKYAQSMGYHDWEDYNSSADYNAAVMERIMKDARDRYLRRLGYDGEEGYRREMVRLEKLQRKAAIKQRQQEIKNELIAMVQQAESRPVVPVRKKGESAWDYAERVGEYQRAQQRYDEDHPVEAMGRDQAMKAVRDLVNDQLVRDSVSQMDKRTLNSILRTLSSTNNDNLTASLEEAKRLVNRIRVRANQVDIQRLLDLKVADVNGKNMNIAKNVDDVTRRIMERLKTTVNDITESGLEDRIHDLRADNWRLREELRNMDPEADSQEILDKIEENNKKIDSLNEERKRILDKKGRDGDVNVDKAIEALQAKMDKDGEKGGEIDENDLIDMTALQIRKLILDGNVEDLNVIEMEGKLAAVKRAKRMLFDKYKDQLSAAKAAVDAEPSAENLAKWKEISQEYVNQRDKLKNMERGLNRIVNEAQANKMDIQETLLAKLNDVVTGGKESLKNVIEQQQKNRLNVLRGAYNDIRGGVEKAKPSDKDNDKNKKEHWAKSVFTSALGSFEYMCQNIATNSLGKDSFMYKYFVTGDKGVIAANNTLVEGRRAAKERLDEKVKEIFAEWKPDRRERKRDRYGRFVMNALRADGQDLKEIKTFNDWWQVMDLQPVEGEWGRQHNVTIDGVAATTGVTVLDMTDVDDQGIPNGTRYELKDLSKGQATYVYQLWKMNDGRGKLEQMGFDEASMEQVADYIGEENMKMADWIQDEFLQESREKYNSRYNEIYNTSLAAIENYVPLKINGGEVQENIDLTGDSGKGAGKLVVKTGALINRTVNDKSIDLKWSAAGVLWDHIEKMEEFYAFSPVRRDLSWVLSSTYFRNQVNKNSKGSFDRLVKAAEIAVKAQQESNEGYMDRPMAQIQKGLIGGNIAYRTCTALKQMLSVPAFYGYSQDPEFMAMLTWNIGWMYGKNMHNVALSHFSLGMTGESTFENTYKGEGNRLQRLSDEIVWCMQNVPDFYDRVMKGTMGNVRLDEKGMEGALGRSLDKYMSNGMRANQMVDAITCGIGIKTIYDYKMKKARKGIEAEIGRLGDDWTEEMKDEYRKKKMEEEHNKAIMEATVYYNSTQQSNNVAFLSPMQVSKSFVDRFNTVYQNASLGFSRQFVSSVIDLNRQFKDRKRLNEEYVRQYLEEMGYKMDGTKIDPAGNAAGTEANGEQPKTAAKSFEDAQREARMKAHDHLKNEMKKNFVSVALYGFILNAIWDQGNKFIAGTWLGDDQEEEKGLYDYATDIVSFVGRGTTGMNWISALLKGQVPQTGLAFSEISQFVENFNRINEESGFSPELAYLCAERLLRFGGVYPQTWTNMYLGTERFFRDSARLFDDEDPAGMRDLWMDLLACINNPNSSTAIRAKQLYMDKYRKMYGEEGLRDHLGECIDAYVRDVSRAMRYKVEDDKWENWLPSIKVLKEKSEESLRKEFIERNLTPDERAAMESFNEFKKEVKDLKDLDSAQKLFKQETDEGRREMIISKMRSLAKEDEADGGMEDEIAEMLGHKGRDKQEWEKVYIQNESDADAFEDIRLSQKVKEMGKANREVNKLYAQGKDKEAMEYEQSHKEEIDRYWELYDIILDLREAKQALDPAAEKAGSVEEKMKEIRRIRREALRR